MMPPSLTLLASLDPLLRERAITAARTHDDALVVIRHELTTLELDGCVHRVVEIDGVVDDVPLPVAAGCCLSCLLRDDTEQALADLPGRRVLLALPPSVEPATVAVALVDAGAARLSSIATALDADRLEQRLRTADPLATIEHIDGDPRRVAEVAIRHLDHADLVLHEGASSRAAALVEALSSAAAHRHVDDPDWVATSGYDHQGFLARLQPGIPRVPAAVDRDGVAQRGWQRRRPLHPQRLMALLESGDLDGLVRASGWLWVATRPGTVLEIEAGAGGYELGVVDAWLDAVDDHSAAHPARRQHASAHWHAYYGDRAQELVLTSLDRHLDDIVGLLDGCLVTDAELADGPEVWRSWPDPFTPWLGDETELLSAHPEDLR